MILSNFWQRLITGTIFVALLSFCIVCSKWTYVALFGLITLLGQREYLRLNRLAANSWTNLLALLSGAGIFFGSFLYCSGIGNAIPVGEGFIRFHYEVLIILLLFPSFFMLKDDKTHAAKEYLFSLFYVVLPFSMVNMLVFSGDSYILYSPYHGRLLMGFFILLWANDTFAYLSGRSFGKRKLFERVSPKKTWEGLIGGALISMLFSQIMPFLFPEVLKGWQWAIIALIIAVFATLGDLGESALKRSLDVKDSGNLLPGHGGILDRFDGLLGAMPWVVTYFILQNMLLN